MLHCAFQKQGSDTCYGGRGAYIAPRNTLRYELRSVLNS